MSSLLLTALFLVWLISKLIYKYGYVIKLCGNIPRAARRNN